MYKDKIAKTSPIFGMTVAVADNICTADMPTTCASKMLADFKSPYDATVVARLKEQGAIIVGKANMDEFNICPSIKIAETVASGCVRFTLASDTCGQIRIPAANLGLVGYKPSYGAVSRLGLLSYSNSFDQIGAIARNVSNAALLISAVSGHDESDATTNPKFIPDFSGIDNFNIKGKIIGRINDNIFLPTAEYAASIYAIIASAEASSNLAKYDGLRYGYRTANFKENDVDSLYINSRTEGFGEEVKRLIIAGTYVLSSENYDAYYKRARVAMAMLREEIKAAFEKCDVILTPVSLETAVLANIAGLPAISLPQNIQLIGKRFDDANLLGFARALEIERGDKA